jgi:hypothetical protein
METIIGTLGVLLVIMVLIVAFLNWCFKKYWNVLKRFIV